MTTPGPDDGETSTGDGPPPVAPRQQQPPPDNAVTEIMPRIVDWPEPGREPPAPPTLKLPPAKPAAVAPPATPAAVAPPAPSPRPAAPAASAAPAAGPAPTLAPPIPAQPAIPVPRHAAADAPPVPTVPPDWPDAFDEPAPVAPEDAKTVILGKLPTRAVAGVLAATALSEDSVRSGPTVLEADSWESSGRAVPPPADDAKRSRTIRMRVMLGLVMALLAAVVAVPFALAGGESPAPVAGGLPTALDEPPSQISAISSEPTAPASVATAQAATPRPTEVTSVPVVPVEGGTTSEGQSSTGTPTAAAPTTSTGQVPPPPPPPFAPVTFEGEAGTRTGSAGIWDGYPNASGGRIVRNIGNWGGTAGTLRINNVVIPSAGNYVITVYFVHIDNERDRSAIVAVSGQNPVTVGFVGTTTCCQAKAITMFIGSGTRTITFSNPTGHAPSIDRVVVSRAS